MTATTPTPYPLVRRHPDHQVGDHVLVTLPGHPLFGGIAQITGIDRSEDTGLAIHTVNHLTGDRLYGDEIDPHPYTPPTNPDAARVWDLARRHGWMTHQCPGDAVALISGPSPADGLCRRIYATFNPARWTVEAFPPFRTPASPRCLDTHDDIEWMLELIARHGTQEDQ